MNMRKMFCFALVFLLGITASVNAQVAIGSEGEPHKAAILDLKSANKGLLLPRIALNTNDLTEFKLEGGADKASATGMLVYNTTDDKVYCWNGERWNSMVNTGATATIPVTGISILSPPTSALMIGATHQLGCSVVPENATNRNVSWSSSVPSVATVDQTGKVTAQAIGSTTITVTTEDGDIPASIPIQVALNTPIITGYSPEKQPSAHSISQNGSLTFNITVANTSEELVYDWYAENSDMFHGEANIPFLSPPQGTGTKITKTTGTFIMTHGTATGGDYKWTGDVSCSFWFVYCVVSLKNNPEIKVTSDYFLMRRGWGGVCP